VVIQLGASTDTFDREGTVVQQAETVNLELTDVKAVAEQLMGPLEMAVPKFSAVKVAGQKLYDYARRGEDVVIPRRQMEFKTIDVQSYDVEKKQVRVRMTCSKGSYVRSWAQELGERLKVGAHVLELTRWFSAPYSLNAAITIPELQQLQTEATDFIHSLRESQSFVDLSNSMPAWPAIRAMGSDARLIANGVLSSSLKSRLAQTVRHSSGGRILSSDGQQLLALVETDEYSNPRIRRVFRYNIDETKPSILERRIEPV